MDALDSPLLWMNFILWIIGIGLILIVAKICRNLSQKREYQADEAQQRTFNIWSYFFILLAISNILILIWRFAIPESNAILIDIIERSSNVLFYLACFIKVYDIEKSLIRSDWYHHHYFSTISIIAILINAAVPPAFLKAISAYQLAFLILVTISFAVFPIIYLYVALKSSGKIRRGALKVCVGAMFLALGYLFRPENLEGYRGLSPGLNTLIDSLYITAPIAIIIAVLLIYHSFRDIE